MFWYYHKSPFNNNSNFPILLDEVCDDCEDDDAVSFALDLSLSISSLGSICLGLLDVTSLEVSLKILSNSLRVFNDFWDLEDSSINLLLKKLISSGFKTFLSLSKASLSFWSLADLSSLGLKEK